MTESREREEGPSQNIPEIKKPNKPIVGLGRGVQTSRKPAECGIMES